VRQWPLWIVEPLLSTGEQMSVNDPEQTWRLKKQTFARHLELRSGRPETANRVFGSYVRHHDRDWRTEASFAVRRTPSRAQILGIPLVARALDRLLEHIAQPMPRRIFTIRGVLIPY
jgi:hypothetical protein